MRAKLRAFALAAGLVGRAQGRISGPSAGRGSREASSFSGSGSGTGENNGIAEKAAVYESQAARFARAGGSREVRAAAEESLDANEHVAAEGSQAARLAASVKHGLDGARAEAPSAVAHGQKETMAKSMKMRGLKFSSPKEGERQLGVNKGPRPGGGRGGRKKDEKFVEDSASSNGKNRDGSGKRTNRRQGSDGQSPAIKLGDIELSSRGKNKRNGRKEDGKDNRNKMTQLSDVADPSSIRLYKREKNSDKNSKNVVLEDQRDGETIADALMRMQPALRPEVEPEKKKRTERVSAGDGFPYRYPKIRYVPWEELTGDTREIVGEFGYNKRSWNDLSQKNKIEGRAFADLTEGQRRSALFLGIDENVWDCFVNHYTTYGKQRLVDLGLWEDATALSNAQSKWWKDMSKDEVQAATKFCYFEESWNGEALGTW